MIRRSDRIAGPWGGRRLHPRTMLDALGFALVHFSGIESYWLQCLYESRLGFFWLAQHAQLSERTRRPREPHPHLAWLPFFSEIRIGRSSEMGAVISVTGWLAEL